MSEPIELLPSPEIDENLLAAERLENLRGTMLVDGLEVLVLTNPVSIRYATGYRAYSSFQSRIPSAYAIVPLVGPIIMHGAYIDDLARVEVVVDGERYSPNTMVDDTRMRIDLREPIAPHGGTAQFEID